MILNNLINNMFFFKKSRSKRKRERQRKNREKHLLTEIQMKSISNNIIKKKRLIVYADI